MSSLWWKVALAPIRRFSPRPLSLGQWRTNGGQGLDVRDLKRAGAGSSAAFIPLHFAAGDALQFDWSEERVVLGGIEQKVKVAHFRRCHSRKPFVRAYPGESQEMARRIRN